MFIFYVTYIVSLLYLSLDRLVVCFLFLFFFKQKTAYEMRISDWSSDVCSSDLVYMVTGSPGGSTIISTVMQSIVNVVAFGMNMQQAVDAPRMHMQWLPDLIAVEPGLLTPDAQAKQIGRASCRERVCQYGVALGGRRIIKKNKKIEITTAYTRKKVKK